MEKAAFMGARSGWNALSDTAVCWHSDEREEVMAQHCWHRGVVWRKLGARSVKPGEVDTTAIPHPPLCLAGRWTLTK